MALSAKNTKGGPMASNESVTRMLAAINEKLDGLGKEKMDTHFYEVRHAELQERFTKLESQIMQAYVSEARYRPEHDALLDKIAALSVSVSQYHAETAQERERIVQQIGQLRADMVEQLEKTTEKQLSSRDRMWIRGSQIAVIISVVIAFAALFVSLLVSGHLQFL